MCITDKRSIMKYMVRSFVHMLCTQKQGNWWLSKPSWPNDRLVYKSINILPTTYTQLGHVIHNFINSMFTTLYVYTKNRDDTKLCFLIISFYISHYIAF